MATPTGCALAEDPSSLLTMAVFTMATPTRCALAEDPPNLPMANEMVVVLSHVKHSRPEALGPFLRPIRP